MTVSCVNMSQSARPGSGEGTAQPEKNQRGWYGAIAAIGVGLVVVIGIVMATFGTGDSGSGVAQLASSSTTVPLQLPPPSTTVPGAAPVTPSGRVAYISDDGGIWAGEGAYEPRRVAEGAALGESGIGAIAIAPSGDAIAYVRDDGAVVLVPFQGGDVRVVATDAALDTLENGRMIAWDAAGVSIAYLATGTADMVKERVPEEDRPPVTEGHFRVPLPDAGLGAVFKLVDREGTIQRQIGDPSLRWVIGVTASSVDDMYLIESLIPGTADPYTLALVTPNTYEFTSTALAVDQPEFSPDGNFVVGVGPAPGGRHELIRVATDTLTSATLVQADRICQPRVSPDGTRIVFGSGEKCDRLSLVSSRGGNVYDITPTTLTETPFFGHSKLGWTADGLFITITECVSDLRPDQPGRGTAHSCGGPSIFLNPDHHRAFDGMAATTVSPIVQPRLQDLYIDVRLMGTIEYEGSFLLNNETAATSERFNDETHQLRMTSEETDRRISLSLQSGESMTHATGEMHIFDPEAGIDSTLFLLAEPSAFGFRVISVSGVWSRTAELPMATGEFQIQLRRR